MQIKTFTVNTPTHNAQWKYEKDLGVEIARLTSNNGNGLQVLGTQRVNTPGYILYPTNQMSFPAPDNETVAILSKKFGASFFKPDSEDRVWIKVPRVKVMSYYTLAFMYIMMGMFFTIVWWTGAGETFFDNVFNRLIIIKQN